MKTIQIEVRLSDWAEYVAQDENGQWWGAETELFPDDEDGAWYSQRGRMEEIVYGPPNENWRDTLRKV
jgi:hypothetical protein